MQKFPSRPRNVTQKDKFLFITTNLSDVCLSICRFRRVITHRHANHFGQTSYPSNTLILILLLTLPPALLCNPLFHGRTFIPSHTQLFPPSFLNTAVGRFFFSSHLSPQCLFLSRLHYRPSQPSNPSTSFPGIFKNHVRFILSFLFYFTYRSSSFQRSILEIS